MDILTRLATFPEPDIFKTILTFLCDCDLKKLMSVNSHIYGVVKMIRQAQVQKQVEHLKRWNRVDAQKVTIIEETLDLNSEHDYRIKILGIDHQYAYISINDGMEFYQRGPVLVFDYKANAFRGEIKVTCDYNSFYSLTVASTDKTLFIYTSTSQIAAISKESLQVIATSGYQGHENNPGQAWNFVLTCPKATSETVIVTWFTCSSYCERRETEIVELCLSNDSQLNIVGKWNVPKSLKLRVDLCSGIYYFWEENDERCLAVYPWNFKNKQWFKPMKVRDTIEVALRILIWSEIRQPTWPFNNCGSMRGHGNTAFIKDRFILHFDHYKFNEYTMIDLDSLRLRGKKKGNAKLSWLVNLLTWKQSKSYFSKRNEQTRDIVSNISDYLANPSKRNAAFSPDGSTHLQVQIKNNNVIAVKKVEI